MLSFKEGDVVRLVPTQGCYQKERSGSVIKVTEKRVKVAPSDGGCAVSFNLSDGMPVAKYDRQFPCYVVKTAV